MREPYDLGVRTNSEEIAPPEKFSASFCTTGERKNARAGLNFAAGLNCGSGFLLLDFAWTVGVFIFLKFWVSLNVYPGGKDDVPHALYVNSIPLLNTERLTRYSKIQGDDEKSPMDSIRGGSCRKSDKD
ncbi:hypothetical protein H5410_042123 [Solanum commersonii]|uniref:Uncharacterized protein n=1 Tax=Solanum commersonii TaxID=4109 RepID=A0A9J5XTV2_SOLCO|nr:hypothetical protein H5410_042123 [Solanum commersonii]